MRAATVVRRIQRAGLDLERPLDALPVEVARTSY
jgi:hypothetical protein